MEGLKSTLKTYLSQTPSTLNQKNTENEKSDESEVSGELGELDAFIPNEGTDSSFELIPSKLPMDSPMGEKNPEIDKNTNLGDKQDLKSEEATLLASDVSPEYKERYANQLITSIWRKNQPFPNNEFKEENKELHDGKTGISFSPVKKNGQTIGFGLGCWYNNDTWVHYDSTKGSVIVYDTKTRSHRVANQDEANYLYSQIYKHREVIKTATKI